MRLRLRRVATLSALGFVLAAGGIGAASPDATAFTLGAGDRAFWQGPGGGESCGADCWAWTVEVTEPAYRLRVAIDRPLIGDIWTAQLLRPDGSSVGTVSPGVGLYSAEVLEEDPEVGTFEVIVRAEDVTDLRFRMRAALETSNGGLPDGPVPVPPNLLPLPPWDLSFTLPVTNGLIGESVGVPLPGGRVACHPEEVVLEHAVRCLRMAFGVQNSGLGPLELVVGPGEVAMDRDLQQRVYNADGSSTLRDAGEAYYHASHAHYHHQHAVGLELLRVVDADTGELEAVGEQHLKGFAHRDELLREWTAFHPTWTKRDIGLLPGWADYYEWDRPGNYIDFGLSGDGLYVLRAVSDPVEWILETNEADNVAYSLIRVTGAEVEHLQSGRGSDPWDRCRSPLPLGPDFADSFSLEDQRPDDCPPIG